MTKGRSIPAPEALPITSSIPWCGKKFFEAGKEASYRLAKKGVIPTIDVGTRNKRALPRVLQRRLMNDPQEATHKETARIRLAQSPSALGDVLNN